MRALLSAAILFVLTISASAAPKAFPGAVGYGADAVGGRGGEVCIVKTLADDGPNSLRDCVMRTTPRTVVFQVSGTIELQTQIITSYGFITIAGQSSPNGIVVRCALDPVMCRSPLQFLDTSEVIIRHLRILPGFFVDALNKPKPNFPRANVKGITFERSNQIYLDHMSVGFTADETIVCFQGGKNWTIANSLNGDAFSHSGHHYGPALCGDQHRGIVGNITFVRNFMHSFKQRNPVVKTTGCVNGAVDVVNNFISNPGQWGITLADDHVGPDGLGTCANIVGNVARKGAMTNSNEFALINDFNMDMNPATINWWYATDNLTINTHDTRGPIPIWRGGPLAGMISPGPTSPTPVAPLTVTAIPATNVVTSVMALAGAWPRTSFEEKILREARDGTGPLKTANDAASLDSNGNPVVWPVIGSIAAPLDSDEDGMPDVWEMSHGLNEFADDHNDDRNADGYTNLEEYLAERHSLIVGVGTGPQPPGPGPQPPPPTIVINFTASQTQVIVGRLAELQWKVTGAPSCTSSSTDNSWTGPRPLSGKSSVRVYVATTYTLTCGGQSKSLTVTVRSGGG